MGTLDFLQFLIEKSKIEFAYCAMFPLERLTPPEIRVVE